MSAGTVVCDNCHKPLMATLRVCPSCGGRSFGATPAGAAPTGAGPAPPTAQRAPRQPPPASSHPSAPAGPPRPVPGARPSAVPPPSGPGGAGAPPRPAPFPSQGPAAQPLRIADCRDGREHMYLAVIYVVDAIFVLIAAVIVISLIAEEQFGILAMAALGIGGLVFMAWFSWKLFMAHIQGHSIEVGPTQYPQVYRVVKQAADQLGIQMPTIMILQGHGVFELYVARRFSRRGFIIITSNMMDEFAGQPNSRAFMMFVGRQLGHIAAGHFSWWFLKDGIGRFALFFHTAWKRRCHFTADNIGLLAAGDLYAAEQALVMITAGARIAPGTSYDAIAEQRTRLFEGTFAWIRLLFDEFPYMVDRIVRLRDFVREMEARHGVLGVLPVTHMRLRTMPLLLVHGHDHGALLELREVLAAHFPFVAPRVMLTTMAGSLSLPEKFDRVAADVVGAIALVTPDDVGAPVAAAGALAARARQNVVIEIGWVWGRLGRDRCLLLLRGGVELPSDLSGVDVQRFARSPSECVDTVRAFIDHLDVGQRAAAA